MNKKKATVITILGIFLMVGLFPNLVLANQGERGGRHQGPPQEAFSACEDKSEGDTASFETANGDTITGVCKKDRHGDRLLLIPDNAPKQGRSNNNRE